MISGIVITTYGCANLVTVVDTLTTSLELAYNVCAKRDSDIVILNVCTSTHSEFTLKRKGVIQSEKH